MTTNKFWNVKTDGKKSRIDLFGYVGGSKEYNLGFNEEDFLKEIRAVPEDNELEVSVNSFGGSVFTGLSIYTLLSNHKGALTIRVDGVAMSAATIITSAPNAKVIMPRGSMMMIHKVSTAVAGNADEMRRAADDLDKIEQNILDIYAKKTKKKCEEIKPFVDAETYFTAEEAAAFGLADEIDEGATIENKFVGDAVMVNGVEMSAKLFEHAPKNFLDKREKPAENNSRKKEENSSMDIEKLKAEYPELIAEIRNEAKNEGVSEERARIKAIEEIAVVGYEDMANDAKFVNACTAEQLAVAMWKKEKARKQTMIQDRAEEAKELEGLHNAGNEGIELNKPEAKKSREEQIAEEKAAFAAAMKA